MCRHLFCLILALNTFLSWGQLSKELRPGDELPPITLKQVLNSETGTLKLQELKGKLILLDFWTTYCSPCVKMLPRLDSLQEEFADSLQVISVTVQDKATIEKFLAGKGLHSGDIYYVTSDTVLSQYFPYRLIPHLVWIAPDGRVLAITEQEAVTRQNIRAILRDAIVQLQTKKDDMQFDYNKPYNPDPKLINYRSLLTGFNDGIGGGMLIDPLLSKPDIYYADSVKRVFIWNNDIASLFFIAFSHYTSLYPNYNRIVLEVKDTLAVKRPPDYKEYKNWEQDNLYCYELMFKEQTDATHFFNYMFEDLNRSLPYQATIEKTMLPCWVISNPGHEQDKLFSKDTVETIEWKFGGIMHRLRNKTMNEVVRYMNAFSNTYPFVDETGIKGKVDIEVDLDFGRQQLNIEQLKNTLARYGLQLKEEQRSIDALVIRERR